MRFLSITLLVGLLMAGLHADTAIAAVCASTYQPDKVALPDLGANSYQGQIGGMYPAGSNAVPAPHLVLGQKLAAEVLPRAASGQASPAGKIGLISIGVSNTSGEFHAFTSLDDSSRDPSVVLVNGAQHGEAIQSWLSPTAQTWAVVEERLAEAGISTHQVQVAWVKLPERDPSEAFPLDASTYADDLAKVLRNLKTNFPNVKLAYLSSRIYGGYGTELNPEPWAYQHGFGVKWTIEAQIDGDPTLNADPARGTVMAPWAAWGPYLWANGLGSDKKVGGVPGRSDGLEWLCSDFAEDGIHPSDSGALKVANMLLTFFQSEPTACGWFLAEGVKCGAEGPGTPPPPEEIFADIAESPFAADIIWLAQQGITKGCNPPSNTLFCPKLDVDRGAMAAFLRRALDLPASSTDHFDDDDGSIFEADINAIADAGITRGCNPPENNLYCPKDTVQRDAMAAFLRRALELAPTSTDHFGDDDGSIFEADINAIAEAGITKGCNPPENNLYCPDDTVSRETMAAFLHRGFR